MTNEPPEAMARLRAWLDEDGQNWGQHEKDIDTLLDTHRASSDEVERVARAICNADGEDPDLDLAGPNGRSGIPNWHPYRNLARAALAAMSAQFDKGANQ